MFPVRAVNQILFEPLCKSVHTCAKFLPIVRSHSAEALRRGGRAAQGWDARGPSGPRPPARLARTAQVGFCGYRVRGEDSPSLPHPRSIETGVPHPRGWRVGLGFPASLIFSFIPEKRRSKEVRAPLLRNTPSCSTANPWDARPIPGLAGYDACTRVSLLFSVLCLR